jgi:2-methylisocitrate lyase-like PEP mutase family enzyme
MDRCETFRLLHAEGLFVMPNPWDVGSAVRLQAMGFPALATTSSGFAWSIGKQDQQVTLDELLRHVEALVAAIEVPLNVDAERCYADDPAGVARTVELIGATGAAGCSIEDYDPGKAAIDPLEVAVERVGAAASAAASSGLVLTARAEQHLYGSADLDDTIARLCAYRDAGAEVLYAPGIVDLDQIEVVVREVERPINVLKLPAVPDLAALAGVGVRRISTGGALARTAYTAMRDAAAALLAELPV